MYSKRSGLVLGFHGCDKSIRDEVVSKQGMVLKASNNDYDWLGGGVYFWENNYERALDFANFLKTNHPHNKKQIIKEPSVIGAVIDLGYCLDLLDAENLNLLKNSYDYLKQTKEKHNLKIPENVPLYDNGDLLKRYLDCAVIELIHQFNEDNNKPDFQTVRGVFFEGEDLYPNAGFKDKNHIQIAVRNPNCIKGYFIPREMDNKYTRP